MKIKNQVKIFFFASFLYGFQWGLLLYILSSYFVDRIGQEQVSLTFFIAYGLALAALLFWKRIIAAIGIRSNLILTAALNCVFTTLAALFFFSFWGVVVAAAMIIFEVVLMVAIDLALEEYSLDEETGSIRGANLTLMNWGVLFGPLAAGAIIEKVGMREIFIVSAAVVWLIAVLGFLSKDKRNVFQNKQYRTGQKNGDSLKVALNKIFKNKNLRGVFVLALMLDFFYATTTVYVPLYLLEQGMRWGDIGRIFFVMLLPFVIIQYPLGRLADKKIGEKEGMILGTLLISAFTLAIYFNQTALVVVWMVILLGTRIGAAIVEVMRDAYFYKQVDVKDVELIDLFRSSRPAASLLAMAFFGALLLIVGLKEIFLLLALLIFLALLPVMKIKDTK